MTSSNDIVTLDVGGHIYRTTITTLTRYPDSMLGAMFGGDFGTLQDDQGRYFIDRDGTLFRHVLNFLRTNQLTLPEDFRELPLLEIEADFYQIQPLIEALVSYKARLETDSSLETGPDQETSPCDSCSNLTPVKMTSSNDIVTLDVGGHTYRTTVSTLTRYPDSMLGAMFGGDSVATFRDDQGRYFVDRNGKMFEHVLNFLRTDQLALPEDFKELSLLEIEADFYQIQPLIEALASYKARLETNPCEFEP
ncbi:KCTD21 [Branchiostoma lanceolatum]|uniref:KCTD21 protein n=1 Tax=Branchiostoma lanceolatum TaxID=7740 RepID=A0A8K0EUZ9_BRALA|nr:KCTD21 [Branchiostoma lanceolatum]